MAEPDVNVFFKLGCTDFDKKFIKFSGGYTSQRSMPSFDPKS